MKKIGYLGAGIWGYALASLLSSKGYKVMAWSIEKEAIKYLKKHREHPTAKGFIAPKTLQFTTDIEEALDGKDLIVEGVTSAGIRSVFEKVKKIGIPGCPIVLTSKGIEKDSSLLLSDVVLEVLGQKYKRQLAVLSGPSIAMEVLNGLPTSVVCSAYDPVVMRMVQNVFSNPTFHVYCSPDIYGVELGGALKNIIAIACGISDGLGFGDNAKAALITRGLHEMRKIAVVMGCKPETLNGLSGMGDLCVTCLSKLSRNYRFGFLIGEGLTVEKAQKKIGMVVEGVYACLSAMQVARKFSAKVPIIESVYKITHESCNPVEAARLLLRGAVATE